MMDIPAWAAPRATDAIIAGGHILFRRDYKFKEGLIAEGKFTNEGSSTEFEPLNGIMVILMDEVEGRSIRLG
jgi:hypothetical protein